MHKKLIVVAAIVFCLATVRAFSAPEITPMPGQVNPYKTRAELLMQAAQRLGVTTPQQAAALWADGLQQRSAALQYVAMTTALRREYAAQLDDLGSNWVTGVSSPWVEEYTAAIVTQPGGETARANLSFALITSAGPTAQYSARLWLVREDGFWRVAKIEQDEGLYEYTRYRANGAPESAL